MGIHRNNTISAFESLNDLSAVRSFVNRRNAIRRVALLPRLFVPQVELRSKTTRQYFQPRTYLGASYLQSRPMIAIAKQAGFVDSKRFVRPSHLEKIVRPLP